MLDTDRINEIHRLHHGEHWSMRKIARHLHLARKTLRKYLDSPVQTPAPRTRTRKIDPFKPLVASLLEQDPSASAVVILQRLRPLGYDGGITILRACVSQLRSPLHPPRAFVRMEPSPGERFEIDWGHFGALDYAGDMRKLYAFCLVDGHSRMLYVEFTHSQSFETFVRCHLHAFQALGGVARECWYDNLLTVVAEHVGTLVRFNPRFLGFARECDFYPRACNPAAGWEKGKVERGGVGYLRQNFWPLREFTDLADVNRQVREWLNEVANQRLHRETRQRPCDRFVRTVCDLCQPSLPITATRPRSWCKRTSVSSSTPIVTVLRLISWASASLSKPMARLWRSITGTRKSSVIPAAGGAVKPWEQSVSRKSCLPIGLPPSALRPSDA